MGSYEDAMPPWLDLPEECARLVASKFVFDGKHLARLALACKFWKEIALDEQVWQDLVTQRFGADWSSIPSPALQPMQLPGWTFLQGVMPRPEQHVDQWEDMGASPEGARGRDAVLTIAALANSKEDAPVFTTAGCVFSRLPSKWAYVSFAAGEGSYVRDNVSAGVSQKLATSVFRAPPQPSLTPTNTELPEVAAGLRPPDFPGFVFYPCLESPDDAPFARTTSQAGGSESECRTALMQLGSWSDVMARCRSLSGLANVAATNGRVVAAFTTRGVLKTRVSHPRSWVSTGSMFHGIYIREDIASLMRLPPPPPAGRPPWRWLYAEGSRAWRSIANDQGCGAACGLYYPSSVSCHPPGLRNSNGYVVAAHMQGALSPEATSVRNVCWLDINATWPGVGPGRYACVWRLKLHNEAGRHVGSWAYQLHASVSASRAHDVCTGAQVDVAASVTKVQPHTVGAGGDNRGAAGPSGVGHAEAAASGHAAAVQGLGAGAGDPRDPVEEQEVWTGPGTQLVCQVLTQQRLGQLSGQYAGGWFHLEVGEFEVQEGVSAVLHARLHNTDTWWKSGLHVDCVALVPRGSASLTAFVETADSTSVVPTGRLDEASQGVEQVQPGDGRGGSPLQATASMLLNACRMQ